IKTKRPDCPDRLLTFHERCSCRSEPTLDQHLLDFADRLRRIETLRAGLRTIHDRMAAAEAEGVFQVVEAFAGRLVAAVDQPAIGLEEDGGAKIALAVPPVARTGGRAAGAQDAFIVAVELEAVLMA